MKLFQLNIWHGRLMMNVQRFLDRNPCDILCLQETLSNEGTDEFMFNNIQRLQKNHDLPHLFLSPVMDFRTADTTTHFGNAILSKYPVQGIKTVFTYREHRKDFSFASNEELPWNFQHAIVDGHNIINHHGFWVNGPKVGNDETMKQMGMVADYIATLDGPVIFTGDLNLWPQATSLNRFNETMRNLVAEYDIQTTRNFTSFKEIEICDYIFVNDNVKVNGFKVYDDVVSDHNILELDFG